MKYYNKKIKLFSTLLLSFISILGFSQAAPSPEFHDTKGDIEVNGAGQFQFTLPIAQPPGVRSVAPQFSLVYISGNGNGVAGYGWNISGITSISRIGKIVEKYGEAKGIQLDYSDDYSFNGQRLILKSGEYGKDGAEYVTEKYSNVKIKSVGAYPVNGQLAGPEHFEVTFEDGSQAWYGAYRVGFRNNNIEVTTPLEYNIVKWKDAQGNYITYNYVSAKEANGFRSNINVVVISSIQWGGNETLNKPHFNSIDFTYINRDIKEQSYVQGIEFNQDKILSEVKVSSEGGIFRKYVINYQKNNTNYQFVGNITQYNAQDKPANPVTFSYPNFVASEIDYQGVLPYNSDSFDNVKFTGDFNGDSYLDFIMNNGTVKLGAFNDAYQDISTGKIFNTEAKVVSSLLDEQGQVYNGNGIVQYEGGKVTGYIFKNNTFVKVFEKAVSPTVCTTCDVDLNEGDINGDGISDIFLTLKTPGSGYGLSDKFIIDLKNPNNPVYTYTQETGVSDSFYTNQKYLDIDRDGKIDIINVSNTDYTVFEFVKTSPTNYLKKIKYTGNLVEAKDNDFPILFGDFNGDGNLDFTIPTTNTQNQDNWRFYMGTKNGFNNVLKQNFLKYRKPAQSSSLALIDQHFYSISDINKDGKSDIVFIYSKNKVGRVGNSGNALWRTLQYEVKTLQANGRTDFVPGLSSISQEYNVGGGNYGLFQPLTNPIKSNNNYYDIFVFMKTRVHKYKSQSSLSELSRISSVNQGGVTTSVNYLEVVPNNTNNANFYQKVKNEMYPYFSLIRSDQLYAVSQLLQEGRKQDFRYRGMTGHMQGRGIIGYHQTARSSWYADGAEDIKIWSGAEMDPLKDGLPVKEWSIRTNDESKIFPANLSETNTQLLSFKSTVYQSDTLLDGQVVIAPVSETDKPKIVTAAVPKSTRIKDFLTGIVTSSSITYGDYYLPTQTITNINNGFGVTTTTFQYIHNPAGTGTSYYIGRPKNKTIAIKAYNDTKASKEEYIYENNLLKTLKTWNRNNTGYMLETYNYDGFGNMTGKVGSNSIDSGTLVQGSQYDVKGRFVERSTDNLGLITAYTYNDLGQILTQKDPLGNTITYVYDDWGKLQNSTSNLDGTTSYLYQKDANFNVTVTQTSPQGDISKSSTNKLGQEYKISTKAFAQGRYISKNTQYDIIGRKIKESEPYFEGQSPTQFNTITYDDSVFPAKVTATVFNGKKMETSVSGLTTTVKEIGGYARTTSKTTDALGNLISTTDKGGTITFRYNAAGEQISATYGTNVVRTGYDIWGRKVVFNDPSNGVYRYEYDGLGRPKKTISPKGTKEYTYNTKGLLSAQKEVSTSDEAATTNKTITYIYNDKGGLTSKSGTSNGQAYSTNISYDPQGRVKSVSESGNGKSYIQKNIIYDDKGRVSWYDKELQSSGTITKVRIENVYSAWNGELSQLKNKLSGQILWQLGETNAKGQVLTEKLGAVDITNKYNTSTGFLSEITHSSAVKRSILNIKYNFDAIKNELKSRITGGDFNITETFDYDDNNRLVNWTNPVTGVKPGANRNTYDAQGRILQNDQIGTIKFENPSKVYQATSMTLNSAGTQNYNGDLIQNITYNENNDPVFIDGEKGNVAFYYGLTSMRQKVSYGGQAESPGNSAKEGKFTKFYNEDGSFEIIRENATGKEKHILYIGGTPYESNIVYLKDFSENSGSFKFLHKDYLGSILAISDEAGNKIEQRHYDAWGNFTHLKIGNAALITNQNAIATASLLIDRGYTSHEHFMEVGIIHMNGRLYDPLLRRFLNADENIQEPTNTQIYNKYGYAVNNPLMYNDPTGEVLPFLIGVGLGYFWASVISGAIIGAAISVGIYTIQAAINNNWSLGGFAKALLMGTVTGAFSAGAGQIFSASGFLATVGNGAIAGAGSGGIVSLINGDNFLQGVLKGAVIGGAVAAISYTVDYFISNKSTTSYMEASEGNTLSDGTPVGNRSYARELYKSEFEQQRGLSSNDIYNRANPGGIMNSRTGLIEYYENSQKIEALGVTKTGKDFLSGKMKSKIYLSNKAFSSREQLSYTLQHELNHVRIDWSSLSTASRIPISFKDSEPGFKYKSNLDNIGHYYIQESGTNFLNNNGWQNMINHIPERVFNSTWYRDFNEAIKKLLSGSDKKININFK